jgi:hypothetical protein
LEPDAGAGRARLLGLACLLVTVGYYAAITWAWSLYDR